MSDRFPIVFAIKSNETTTQRPVLKYTYKHSYYEKNIDKFKNTLRNRNWNDFKKLKTAINHVNTFSISLLTFMTCCSQKAEVNVKFKSEQSPWIAKGIGKPSKKNQRGYEKILKNATLKND